MAGFDARTLIFHRHSIILSVNVDIFVYKSWPFMRERLNTFIFDWR